MLKEFFRKLFGGRADSTKLYALDETIYESLLYLAHQHKTTPEEIVKDLVDQALVLETNDADIMHRWDQLTGREKEVTALICLGYTSKQIAVKLSIAEGTVRTHARRILHKFDVSSRDVLRERLRNWNFSKWD